MKSSAVLVLLFSTVFAAAQTQPSSPAAPAHLAPEAAATLAEKKVPAVYPEKARASGIQGTVVLNVLISETGEVKEATATSGDPDLAQAAIDSIKQWKYKPYTVDGKPAPVETQVTFGFHIKAPPVQPPAPPRPADLSRKQASDPVLVGGVVRMRVSAGFAARLAIPRSHVDPMYPWEARNQHIQGTVVLHVIIDREGNASAVTPVSGPDVLISPTVNAVRKWKYKPYLLNGQPIELDTTVEVHYYLGG